MKRKRNLLMIFMCFLSLMISVSAQDNYHENDDTTLVGSYSEGVPISEVLGVVGSHNAKYKFTDKPLLEELADVAEAMGTKVFKASLHIGRTLGDKKLVETAQRQEFVELFNRSFTKYILTSHPFLGGSTNKWLNGITREIAKEIRDEIYELTKYLLTTYKNTGKTFILQNWEADEMLRLWDVPEEKREQRVKAFIDWVNLLQDGVTLAREEVGMEGVWVLFAVETNHVPGYRFWDYPVLMDLAFPYTNADLYSGSIWSSTGKGEGTQEALDYYAASVPASFLYGEKNIYYGEFGSRESSFPPYKGGSKGPRAEYNDYSGMLKLAEERAEIEAALEWGVQFLCYWTIYDNGLIDGVTLEPGQNATNEQLTGVWLIRADGSETPTYNYFMDLFAEDELVYHPDRVASLRNFLPGEITSYRRPTDLSEFPEVIYNVSFSPPVLQLKNSNIPPDYIVEQVGAANSTSTLKTNDEISGGGIWNQTSQYLDFDGDYSLWSNDIIVGNTFIRYTPKSKNNNGLQPGYYKVQFYNPRGNHDTDDSMMKWEIAHSTNGQLEITEPIIIDQRYKPRGWVDISSNSYYFNGDGTEYVKFTREKEHSGRYSRVGSVRFVAQAQYDEISNLVNGTLRTCMTMDNNGGEDIDVTLIIAVYDKNRNILTDLRLSNHRIPKGAMGMKILSDDFEIEEPENQKVKIMVWNNIEGNLPLMNVYQY